MHDAHKPKTTQIMEDMYVPNRAKWELNGNNISARDSAYGNASVRLAGVI